LLNQPSSRTSWWTKILSEEEERSKRGYEITTHFNTTGSIVNHFKTKQNTASEDLLTITQIQQANLWRINHGWRTVTDSIGFTLHSVAGKWGKRYEDASGDEDDKSDDFTSFLIGIKPFTTDTRNILRVLIKPINLNGCFTY